MVLSAQAHDRVNILLVDDQPGKLLSYEAILKDLDENLVKANSAREALEHMLKMEIAVILLDVAMPETDGFQLAEMIREHPRFQKTAIIFISAIQVDEDDRLRGYEIGAVDYVPVPVVPAVLRAKVRVFLDLYRKTQELERLNAELERRVSDRTAELEASTERLQKSEERRNLALAAGHMGSWEIDLETQLVYWDDAKCRIFGIEPGNSRRTLEEIRPLIHPEDWDTYLESHRQSANEGQSGQSEFRIVRPNGEVRWCVSAGATTRDMDGRAFVGGITIDITERKEAEQRQSLLAREVDHRARNTLAVVQSILRLTRADSIEGLVSALDGRIQALARAHTLLSNTRWQGADIARLVGEEMDPYRSRDSERVVMSGPTLILRPSMAQAFALVLHELATNAAKYGALSAEAGRVMVGWELTAESLVLHWQEVGGPVAKIPTKSGFGTRVVIATIERELQGSATFNWRPEGLDCVLTVPRADVTERAPTPRAPTTVTLAPSGPAAASKQPRLLLVEDEPLVAMMMREMLMDLGYAVVGPMSDREGALAAAKQGGIDCAILDLNLAGEASYPIADELAARAVPFIFLTGYDKESIDRRYATINLLQKPVDEQSLRQALSTLTQFKDVAQAQQRALAG